MLTYVDVQIVLLSGKKKNVIQHDATSSSFFKNAILYRKLLNYIKLLKLLSSGE